MDLASYLGGAEHLHPGSRQPDGQRHPLHQAADIDHILDVPLRQFKVRKRSPRSLREQFDGAVLQSLLGFSKDQPEPRGLSARIIHPFHMEAVFTPYIQPRS